MVKLAALLARPRTNLSGPPRHDFSALLHRSVRDNIAYPRPDASDADVKAAASRARALELIEELEDNKGRKGLAAHVGERGVKLSGGQRQRIAIARFLLKDAPILVLEPPQHQTRTQRQRQRQR
jgi:ABC-type multidrug transport system fused ATPase/permease subunit